MDTAAGQGCLGIWQAIELFVHLFVECGKRCFFVKRDLPPSSGIGGKAKPLGVLIIPTGIERAEGVFEMVILEQNVPPLMPVGFIESTRSRLDFDEGSMLIRHLQVETPLQREPSGHRTIFIDRFRPGSFVTP